MRKTDTTKITTLKQMLSVIECEANLNSDTCLQLPQREAETLQNFANKHELSDRNIVTIPKVIFEALQKSDAKTCQRLWRLLPFGVARQILHQWALTDQQDLKSILPLVGVVLQVDERHNLLILTYLARREIRDQVKFLFTDDTPLLEAIIRCLHAQPHLSELWDFSPVFQAQACNILLHHVQKFVCPATPSHPQFCDEDRLSLVSSLMFNKREEQTCRVAYDEESPQEAVQVGDGLVATTYLQQKAQELLREIDSNISGHLCISGPQGSGKMSLLNLTSELYSQRGSGVRPQIIVVTLEATFDSKNLVGNYVCSETGEFVFKKGPLTVAAEHGLWLVLRNIEEMPSDLLSFLLPLVQENKLHVTATRVIRPRLGFKMIFLQRAQADEAVSAHEDIKPLTDLLHQTRIDALMGRCDFDQILATKYPALFRAVSAENLTIYEVLRASKDFLIQQLSALKPHLLDFRMPTITQFLSLCDRVDSHFRDSATQVLSQSDRQLIVEETADVYLAYMYDTSLRTKLIEQLVTSVFNAKFESQQDPQATSEYCTMLGRDHGIAGFSCFFGRVQLPRKDVQLPSSNFVHTSATVRVLEQISMSISRRESMLLVGETGTGKTTAVQEIARILGKQLHVFNLNQNTDSADLLGGFKPVDLKYLLKPIYDSFLQLFNALFERTKNNQKFLDVAQKCYETSKIKEFCQCLQHGFQSIKSKKDPTYTQQTLHLEAQIKELQRRSRKLESQGGFIFQFVEGTLIKSMQNGDWVLLDEINLATESILNKLATIIRGDHVMLNERADVIDMQVHPDFRVFMCMNPPYSSAGKKQLPQSLRSKLTEIYVPEIDNEADLWSIIDKYTKASQQSTLSEENKRTVLQFYIQVRQMISKQTRRGNIGLRNLCRALKFMNAAIMLRYPVVKAIYDSLFCCFASHLDTQMQEMVRQLIFALFKIKTLPRLLSTVVNENYIRVEDSIIPVGKHKPTNFDENDFILTPSFKTLVQQLASVISVSDFAVILEGPTSAGKTSCINYLAKLTHNHVIRINNHMHTDVQEYLGSYVPDATTGKLAFQEGILVEAVRKGYWVILDELNLAPSEVLEALNRLLDDNRELHIVETQKVVKAHPQFRIFATQNPTEGYGGRKELSEAFKNRFVMIRVGDVPTDELRQILEKKCQLPQSRANLMVKVMENLQIYRSKSQVFSGKSSTITVRDLLKWAGRINANNKLNSHVDQYNIALEGFFVLAERSRDFDDKAYIKQTIEKVFGVKLSIDRYYKDYFDQHLKAVFENVPSELHLPPIIMSQQLKRLAVLVHKCLLNREPALLVGETGCGKTTLCQVFAHSVTRQKLFAINCHQNTETSDFIGCMRTRKTLNLIQVKLEKLLDSLEVSAEVIQQAQGLTLKKRAALLFQATQNPEITELLDDLQNVFEWSDGILVEAMNDGGLLLIDEISLANDSVLERLNSVFEHDRTLVISEKSAAEAVKVVADARFNMVATMNPGSDFGKKELSPALRNRMTEIWVESYFQQPELLQLAKEQPEHQHTEVHLDIDLNLIIYSLCLQQLPVEVAPKISQGIFNIICFVNFSLAERYFSMQRKALSIRDILNIIDFVRTSTQPNRFTTHALNFKTAFLNAIELVIVDGVCLGIDTAGEQEKQSITSECRDYLHRLVEQIFGPVEFSVDTFINTVAQIGVSPFVMSRNSETSSTSQFAFDADTTKLNLKKLLRAFTLNKPVLIEGSPGVGKTSLIENLAKQVGKKLIRVNLSDQTDMMDLLGSEYPVPTSDDDQDIQFRWCDGVLLQAIREGHWFLIDEMNLAQQSILEGLNAILDHRRTVYIPELNQEFVCHPDFFVFACQNPSQSSGHTSGRKTLPKSFLNRFSKIYLEDLKREDYQVILNHQTSDMFDQAQVEALLEITQRINSSKGSDKQVEVNMRDLARFLKLVRHFASLQIDRNSSIATALQTCYTDWQQGVLCGLLDADTSLPSTSLVRTTGEGHVVFESLHKTVVENRGQGKSDFTYGQYLEMKGAHAKQVQALCDCLQANLPVLVVTNDTRRLSQTLQVLAKVNGTKLRRVLLNERSDTSQLLGCFEQTSEDYTQIMRSILSRNHSVKDTLKLHYDIMWADDSEKIEILLDFVTRHSQGDLQQELRRLKKGNSRFEWVDSVLVQAVQRGEWTAIENANLCNPSVLDRLNGLFEEGADSLTINEQGLVNDHLREVKKHDNFRAMFIVSEKTLYDQGKDVSKALKNRCLEVKIHYAANAVGSDFDMLNDMRVFTEESQLVFTLAELQKKHDLLPTLSLPSEEVQLGKRQSTEDEAVSLRVLPVPELPEVITRQYPFYLPLLTSTATCPHDDYLRVEISKMQFQLSAKMQQQILDNQITHYLAGLARATPSENLQGFYMLLREIVSLRQLRELQYNTFQIYLQQVTGLKSQVQAEFAFLQETVDFTLLYSVQRPDQDQVAQYKHWHGLLSHVDLDIYCYKLPLAALKPEPSRIQTLLSMLRHNRATVLVLDTDKELIATDDKIVAQLEKSFDINFVLQSPNLLVVPNSLQEPVVLISQSHLYKTLCQVKDLIALHQLKSLSKVQHYRHTSLPIYLKFASEELDLVIRQLTVLHQKPFATQLIQAALEDETSVSIKDLPASYATQQSILAKLDSLQLASKLRPQFDRLADQYLSHGIDSQLQDSLVKRLTETGLINGESVSSGECLRHVTILSRAFAEIQQLRTAEVIKAMFVLPLEIRRQQSEVSLSRDQIAAEKFFWSYHLKDTKEPEFLLQAKSENLAILEEELSKLESLTPTTNEYTQDNLRASLMFINVLREELGRLHQHLLAEGLPERIESLITLVYKQADSLQFASVSSMMFELMLSVTAALNACQSLIQASNQVTKETSQIVGLQSGFDRRYLFQLNRAASRLDKNDYESHMKWLLKCMRLHEPRDGKLQSVILEHFVQREVIKQMLEEEATKERFSLPFVVRDQIIPAPTGKAMDEWTKQDKERMETEAEQEIEVNFPSYFDEVQKAYYSGVFERDSLQQAKAIDEVQIQDVMAEMLFLTDCKETQYKIDYQKERLQAVRSALRLSEEKLTCDYTEWVDDLRTYLNSTLHEQKLKQVMNITDIQISKKFNFYVSPFPSECKLLFQPLLKLQMRLRDVVVKDGYESPLLNESLFLANYMLSSFNVEVTPLMKILTCTEFLLTKLEEWENTYASKRLNSVAAEIDSLKMLVIRYRKIQILSWRNLLNWKQHVLVKNDAENAVRLCHTVTKQVFEGTEDILKLLDLCDLFIRDSTLGTFKPRLQFVATLVQHMKVKKTQIVRAPSSIIQRLKHTINSLQFVQEYYGQFEGKLDQTLARLDKQAREKVKLLIDIKKWTLQKFTVMKSNIDKTHRQLNRACKAEEEVLIQNVQSLVIESSRKKFIGQEDQLLSLDTENRRLSQVQSLSSRAEQSRFSIVRQLAHMAMTKIVPRIPYSGNIQESIDMFMERLVEVRALNKKHIQKKAFYDLHRYMKEEGLRSNFQADLQPLILECSGQTPYFYKAYETYLILKSSSQSEEHSDLKNSDILRCQGFSQHLMYKTLELTLKLQKMRSLATDFDICKVHQQYRESELDAGPSLQFALTETSAKYLRKALAQLQSTVDSLYEQVCVAVESDQNLLPALQALKVTQIPTQLSNANQTTEIFESLQRIIDSFARVESKSLRTLRIVRQALERITEARTHLLEFTKMSGEEQLTDASAMLQRRQTTLKQRIKLLYQELLKCLEVVPVGKVDQADTKMLSTTEAASRQSEEEQPVLLIDEHIKYADSLNILLEKHLPDIQKSFLQVLALKGVTHVQTCLSYEESVSCIVQVQNLVEHLTLNEDYFCQSMAKLAYLSQRVFLYLIYQGFCGQDDQDDPDNEPPSSDLEQDGMGMGEGKGKDNVADEIEHEEQLEGLKNYESEDEKPQEPPDNQSQNQDQQDQDENDFEMKEDFDGEMGDESDSKSDKSQDEDDQQDEVNDQMDQDLWNKNMEDMEEKEKEDKKDEEQPRREQDLGERDLDSQNVMEKDSQLAEGDHDKQQKQSDDEKSQDHDSGGDDQDMASEESEPVEQSGEKQSDSDDDQDMAGLNNDSVPAEPSDHISDVEESKSVSELQSQVDDRESAEEGGSDFAEKSEVTDPDDPAISSDSERQDDDVKQDANQTILEDDQIQTTELDKQNDQANLRKKTENKVEDANNNPQPKAENVENQQVDAEGTDLLFNFAQKLQQRQQQKQAKPESQSKDKAETQIDQPNMVEERPPQEQQPPDAQQDENADEYMHDEQAQQMEGKLATDKVDQHAHQDDAENDEDAPMPSDQSEQLEAPNEDVEMTQQQAHQDVKQSRDQLQREARDLNDDESQSDAAMEEAGEMTEDLISKYNEYLQQQLAEPTQVKDFDESVPTADIKLILQDLERFDYNLQKQLIREMFTQWQQSVGRAESVKLLAAFKNQTQQVTSVLCEQLRIVLEPQLSQNLQGDFKTGKRLNMKKVISFIASNYRNDKIWLRRTLPSKRDYKILIAIDDSLSMKENNLGFFSLEASVALQEALNRLEVGKVAVARIRDRLELVQSFEDNYSAERSAFTVSQFGFKHCAQTSADTSMANFVSDTNKLLDMQNQGAQVNCPFVIVLSDGRFNKDNVRRYLREAKEKKYLYIFVVLDKAQQSIMSMKSAVKQASGGIKLDSYMRDFPFEYYCVVQDTSQLPSALGTILVQWFSMVSNQ